MQAAKQLPDLRQTLADRKLARINLVNATRQVQDNWQLLKLYINAFEKDLVKAKLDAAGASLYRKASVDNWSAMRSLIDAANTFIAANMDELTNGENMPPAFQITFLNDGNRCMELSKEFAQSGMSKKIATRAKVNANNAIYASVMEMFKDAQQVFREKRITKRQFTYSHLVFIFQGESSACLKGYAKNNLGLTVQGVTIISADQKYKANSNSKGYYRINRIAAGTYTFIICCPGYAPIEQQIIFETGTATHINFEMINVMKKAA